MLRVDKDPVSSIITRGGLGPALTAHRRTKHWHPIGPTPPSLSVTALLSSEFVEPQEYTPQSAHWRSPDLAGALASERLPSVLALEVGYQARDRKLVIVDSEAEIVRSIFRRYAELAEGGRRQLPDALFSGRGEKIYALFPDRAPTAQPPGLLTTDSHTVRHIERKPLCSGFPTVGYQAKICCRRDRHLARLRPSVCSFAMVDGVNGADAVRDRATMRARAETVAI